MPHTDDDRPAFRMPTPQVLVVSGHVTVLAATRFEVRGIESTDDPAPIIGYLSMTIDNRVSVEAPGRQAVRALTIADGVAALLRARGHEIHPEASRR